MRGSGAGPPEFLAEPPRGFGGSILKRIKARRAGVQTPSDLLVEVIFTPLAKRHLETLHQYITTQISRPWNAPS